MRAVGAPCAPCFYGGIAHEADCPSLACACRNIEEKCSVGGFYLVRTAHPCRWSRAAGLSAFLHAISQPQGAHDCRLRLATLAGKALLAGGRDRDGGTCGPIPCGWFGAVFHPVPFKGG